MAIQPIFLFSVSRSGSTLTQRVIAAHDGVATVSEPWLLLPYAYALRREGVSAEYFHPLMVTAIDDFCRQLPAGLDDYRQEMREFALRLYEKAANGETPVNGEKAANGETAATDETAATGETAVNGETASGAKAVNGAAGSNGGAARYFLDKSPSYYLVAEEIMRLFPDGKFVFLWRNPLSIMASILETFNDSRWYPSLFRGDLFIGLPRLVAAYTANGSAAHSVRFEDLVAGGEPPWQRLMDYLGIEFDPRSLDRFSEVSLDGRMGDPTGVKRYSALSTEPAQKWKRSLANPVRKAWCRRYLRFLGEQRLATMGYDLDEIIGELDSQPTTRASLAPDLRRLVLDVAKEPVRVRIRDQGIGGPNMIRELLRT
jgi:hypothetical protein